MTERERITMTQALIFAALVLLLFGPQHLPRIARSVGNAIGQWREFVRLLLGTDADRREPAAERTERQSHARRSSAATMTAAAWYEEEDEGGAGWPAMGEPPAVARREATLARQGDARPYPRPAPVRPGVHAPAGPASRTGDRAFAGRADSQRLAPPGSERMTAVQAVPAGESDGGKYRRSELAVAFLQHLADLRAAVVKSLAALMVGVAVAIPLAPYVLDLLKHPLVQAGKEPDAFLRTLEVSGGMTVLMHMSFWTGLLLSMPCILYFAAQYVFPGLTRRERRLLRWVFAPAAILFVAGVVEGYFITLPVGLQILFAISNWLGAPLEFVDLSHYVLYTLKLLLGFGCAFEFPLAVLALGAAGIVTAAQLRDKRRHVIVGVTALAMLLSPPDPYTWFFIAAPILVLQEGCIAIIQTLERRRTAPQQGVQP